MSNIFHADNPFTKFMYRLGSLILLNIYFLICCIPVITIGASITAAEHVSDKLKKETDVKITATFFQSFKSNFLDATLVWIVLAGIGSMIVFAFLRVYKNNLGYNVLICVLCAVGTMAVLMEATYIFRLLGRYRQDIATQLLNAYRLAIGNIFRTLLIWMIWAVPITLFVIFPILLRMLGWMWIAFGFAFVMGITTKIYMRIFSKYDSHDVEQETEQEE